MVRELQLAIAKPRASVADALGARPLLGPAADHVELPLEIIPGGRAGSPADEQLLHDRLLGPSQPADGRGDDRHVPPAQHPLPFRRDDALQRPVADQALGLAPGQEHERHAVIAGSRQAVRDRGVLGTEEGIGELHQDPRPVARVLVAAARPAMLEVPQDLQAAQDGRMALPAAQVGHEPDAAGVALEGRIVKPLSRG